MIFLKYLNHLINFDDSLVHHEVNPSDKKLLDGEIRKHCNTLPTLFQWLFFLQK